MIAEVFESTRRQQRLALMPYLTAGFPTIDRSLEILHTLVDRGADIVELGIPFGDPVADGPSIQYASHHALSNGARLRRILDALESCGPQRVPLVLMSYLNPLLAVGPDRAVERMARVGVSGLIVPDLPTEETSPWLEATRRHGLDLIPLIAPTTSEPRARRILDRSDGFVYYVSLTGTTGVRDRLSPELPSALERLRRWTSRPLAVGFGISTPDHVRRLRGHCDGVVVGSRIVDAIRNDENLSELIDRFKQATRS
jgi:tryptophan synthase alpha subunit